MEAQSNNCPHCGKKLIRPDIAFCNNCGAPLKGKRARAAATVHGGSLAKIIVHIPGQESTEFFLSKAVSTIGRRGSNTIQVLSPIVSGQHARIDLTSKGHTITDLGSTNGTYVSGKALSPNKAQLLNNQDIIRFSDALGNSAHLTYVAPSVFAEIATAELARIFSLQKEIAYIGRNPKNAIVLEHPAVSWNHAKVVKRAEDRYTIQDLSSNNGTFINGTQLAQRREQILARGDVIQFGPFNLVYQGDGSFVPYSAERNFRLELVDLEKTYYPVNFLGRPDKNHPQTILRNFNLVINPREFVAIVGGSGTGKSTLLKAMIGLQKATSGAVLVNGDDLYENYNLYRTMMGYVPQDDIIHLDLPVEQALHYTAQLRLPDANADEVKLRIMAVLDKVGLMAQARTMVRDLSGGQRKRVSIAAELLAEPWIFFLDEPTSGLDPGLEKLMMDTLRQLADEGRTIVLVTHATANITHNCDQTIFLARGSELTYFGPPQEAPGFFNVNDFPDIYTRLAQTYTPANDPTVPPELARAYHRITADVPSSPAGVDQLPAGKVWAAQYRQSSLHKTYVANRQSGKAARPIPATTSTTGGGLSEQLKQFKVLSQRYLDLIRYDKISLTVLLAVMPLLGLFLLIISNGQALTGHPAPEIAAILETDGVYTIVNQAQTLLFMLALAANLLGVFAAAYAIINEEPIYRRERMINLKIPPYFASKFGVLGLFMLLQVFLLLLIISLKVDLPRSGAILWAPLEYYFTLVFTALAGLALGLFISALARSRDTVIYLILIVLFGQIIFSGAIFELPWPARPLSFVTITRWSLEALGASTNMEALNELGQIRLEREVDIGRGLQKVVEDAPMTVDFYINYSYGALALLSRWIFLWVHTLIWGSLAIWQIKQKDEL